MHVKDRTKLLASIAVCEGVGIIGGLYTSPAITTWYATLTKPLLNPPGWVFGPVWTLLYLLMGVSLFLLLRIGYFKKKIRHAVWVFMIQLGLNLLWSIIFFGWHNPAAALAELVLLWGMILTTIIVFWRISRTAAILLLPYILWVTFAGYLNYQILVLN